MNLLIKKEEFISLFEQTETNEGEVHTESHSFVYVVSGKVSFSYGYHSTGKVEEGTLLFLPLGNHINYQINRGSKLIYFQINDSLQINDCFSFSSGDGMSLQNAQQKKKTESILATIKANNVVKVYMEGLAFNMKAGVCESVYLDLKIKELFFLLKAFYSKEELASFFSNTLYMSTAFPAYILKNHHKYDSVTELAMAMSYTVSGFSKKFRKIFGTSPSKWMRDQKAKRIYREVCLGKLNFKEIADKYNFASTSTFNDFFKLIFGETPGTTRRKYQMEKCGEKTGRYQEFQNRN